MKFIRRASGNKKFCLGVKFLGARLSIDFNRAQMCKKVSNRNPAVIENFGSPCRLGLEPPSAALNVATIFSVFVDLSSSINKLSLNLVILSLAITKFYFFLKKFILFFA